MHKIEGKRRAVVIATKAKDNKMKAQVRILAEWDDAPDEYMPWAEYLLSVDRAFVPTQPGDMVWVEFPYGGDSRRPMIVGAAQDWSGGVPNVPPEASGVGEQYQPPEKDGSPKGAELMPTADMVLKRDGVMIIRTASGGYSMTRLADGTAIGFNDSGDVYIFSEGRTYVNATGDIEVITSNNVTIRAGGNVTVAADGNASLEAKGTMSFKAAKLDFQAGSIAFAKG